MQPAGIEIAPLTEPDVPAVWHVGAASFPTPWAPDLLRYRVRHDPHFHGLVARDRGFDPARVVAFVTALESPDFCHLAQLAVEPARRRSGIGGFLLASFLAGARERRVQRVTLELRCSNRDAARFYEAHGFVAVAMLPRYYPDTGDDALVMLLDTA